MAGGKKDTLNETRLVVQGDSSQITELIRHSTEFAHPAGATQTKGEISACIEDTGIIPFVSEASPEDVFFVAEALVAAGIPIIEISMNSPGAIDVIFHLVKYAPKMIVGAG